MTEALVRSICAEFDVEIIPANEMPKPGQTRAVNTLARILEKHGEGHLRLVLSTLAETKNNQGLINEYSAWATSDLVLACSKWIEEDASDWFQAWDRIPLGWLMWTSQELYGIVKQRAALAGAMYVLLVHYSQGRKANKDVDYNFLRRIQIAEGEPSKHDRNREKALETGKRLLEVKAALPRGEFLAWVDREAGLSYQTVQRYMRLAREADQQERSAA
ncbi:DUF3102 domain-containing protein [Sinorhizobium fredii]|uniref:DUF3102 domain-containing protein n=1 Tax=Rhizobium fredii TaxID=380 RepID=UPI0004B6F751|nr:DUF3102 domain-containing protein [Sinorhizobium fredii]